MRAGGKFVASVLCCVSRLSVDDPKNMAWFCTFCHLQFSQTPTEANEVAALCAGEL